MAVDLWLEKLSNGRCVATKDAYVVEGEAAYVRDACEPIPVHCFDEKLAYDDVHDQREADTRGEPVRLSLAC